MRDYEKETLMHYGIKGMKWRNHKYASPLEEHVKKARRGQDPVSRTLQFGKDQITKNKKKVEAGIINSKKQQYRDSKNQREPSKNANSQSINLREHRMEQVRKQLDAARNAALVKAKLRKMTSNLTPKISSDKYAKSARVKKKLNNTILNDTFGKSIKSNKTAKKNVNYLGKNVANTTRTQEQEFRKEVNNAAKEKFNNSKAGNLVKRTKTINAPTSKYNNSRRIDTYGTSVTGKQLGLQSRMTNAGTEQIKTSGPSINQKKRKKWYKN